MTKLLVISAPASPSTEQVKERLRESAESFGSITSGARRIHWAHVDASSAPNLATSLEELPGVTNTHVFDGDYALVARRSDVQKSVVSLGNGEVTFGGTEIPVIAGPCSAETPDQVEAVATAVGAAGGHGLRGGAFKPRTSPYSFQGLGKPGLQILRTVADRYRLPLVTEVMCPDTVELVSEYADMLQIGSRNMQNFPLLKAVGQSSTPILLKRGYMARVEEFLAAAEYIYAAGNENIVLCERGIRSFDPKFRNNLDLSGLVWLKERSHLPVIADPSHAAGVRGLVEPLALAAIAAGADGLIVEVHANPKDALSDGDQALTPNLFQHLMTTARSVASSIGRSVPAPAPAQPAPLVIDPGTSV